MKILAVGDIHSNSSLAEKLAKKAEDENVDLVILTGDLTYRETSTSYIIGPFVKKGKKVLIVPGNHETPATVDFLAQRYGVVNLHGYHFLHEGIGFFGSGGAMIGPFPTSERDIMYLLEKGHSAINDAKKKIMVTHVHPKGSTIEKFSEFVEGSSAVTEAIEKFKPDILFCSHVHEAEGIEEMIGATHVINVAKTGKIIEI